ncbi:hypothetical protein HDV62DRAFT_185149 [Trichoderma sp. SZMC 28011]
MDWLLGMHVSKRSLPGPAPSSASASASASPRLSMLMYPSTQLSQKPPLAHHQNKSGVPARPAACIVSHVRIACTCTCTRRLPAPAANAWYPHPPPLGPSTSTVHSLHLHLHLHLHPNLHSLLLEHGGTYIKVYDF